MAIASLLPKRKAHATRTADRSGYINALLTEHRSQILEAEMIAALKQDAEDPEYQAEIAIWDSVAGDGINRFVV